MARLRPSDLPPADEAKLNDRPSALSAYNICLALQGKVASSEDRMHVRILGYMIIHAPTSAAEAEIVRAIHSCAQDDQTLLELGRHFRTHFILPFKKFKGRTPIPSYHPSRPSFDRLKEDLKSLVIEAPRDHRGAKTQALVRDGYKCIVTGQYDPIAIEESLVDPLVAYVHEVMRTELAHILPESTYFKVSDALSSPEKKVYAASVMAVLKRFGYDAEQVNGPKVHSLYNVMTTVGYVHDSFDRLELWFESTEVANRYRVKTIYPHSSIPGEVTFTSPDPSIYPYPSPQLLALHAACAKVAHLSGASEYIDRFDRDADDMDVLAADGSSSAVLTHALLRSTSHHMNVVA